MKPAGSLILALAVSASLATAPHAGAAEIDALAESGLPGAQSCFVRLNASEAKALGLHNDMPLEHMYLAADRALLTPEYDTALRRFAQNPVVSEAVEMFVANEDLGEELRSDYEAAYATLEEQVGAESAGLISDIVISEARVASYERRLVSGEVDTYEFELYPGELLYGDRSQLSEEGWNTFVADPAKVATELHFIDLPKQHHDRFNELVRERVDLEAFVSFQREYIDVLKQADKVCGDGGGDTVYFPTADAFAPTARQKKLAEDGNDSAASEPKDEHIPEPERQDGPAKQPSAADTGEGSNDTGSSVVGGIAIALGVLVAVGLLGVGVLGAAPQFGLQVPATLPFSRFIPR